MTKKKTNLVKSLEQLEEKDIYSLMLFALYKLKDSKEYSTLSELVYLVDKKSLFNLLSVFGGLTITIPTISELKLLVTGLLIYQLVDIENADLETAIKETKTNEFNDVEMRETYYKICEAVKDYDITK